MERYWTKKRITQLITGSDEALDQWLEHFTGPLYTWLYYHVQADADLAAELTGKTFCAAIRNLSAFNPASEGMYQWLKDQARCIRDEVLGARQMKPQRPWAWSQLPEEVLCAMANFRSEPLADEAIINTSVQELTQATLAEMSQPDRNLLKRRYNHLDTPEHIASESNESIEQINDRLYRCRHFFRRVLMQLIQSENNGFAESSAAGELELLDVNMEKLLSSTVMCRPISSPHATVLRDTVQQTIRQVAATHKPAASAKSPILWTAAAGILLLLIITGGVFLIGRDAEDLPQPQPAKPQAAAPETKPQTPRPAADTEKKQTLEEDFDDIVRLWRNKNLNGLLDILRNGSFENQLAAATFIGQLGDEDAIDMLQDAQDRWYPKGPDDNLFAKAIALIEERLPAESEDIVEDDLEDIPEPNETTPETEQIAADEASDTATAATGLSGTVTSPERTVVPDARIVLVQNPLMNATTTANILGRAQTDEQGNYSFDHEIDAAVFVDCTIPPQLVQSTRRAMLCERETARVADFGGHPVIMGQLDLIDEPADNQILYLSDAMDPADAAFRCENVTNNDGYFIFPGVPAGDYFLLYNTPDNHIVRLDTITVKNRDINQWQVAPEQYELTVHYDLLEGSPLIEWVVLAYGPEMSDEFQEYELAAEDDFTFFGTIPEGSYTLITYFVNDMSLIQDIELTGDREVTITPPDGTASLAGRFTSPSPLNLYLESRDEQLRFDLFPEDGNIYALGMMPADTYTLRGLVNGLPISFLEIDLEDDQRQTLDIDPTQWLQEFSPLYVIAVDAAGNLIHGAEVWLTGGNEVVTTQSTGRGAFLAAPAGRYSLQAACPGKTAVEETVTINQGPLLADPNPGNTVVLTIP